jgi:hypothetical protein
VRKEQVEKRDKSFSGRRERSPSSHSVSISDKEVRADKQQRDGQRQDKKEPNTLKTDENYK